MNKTQKLLILLITLIIGAVLVLWLVSQSSLPSDGNTQTGIDSAETAAAGAEKDEEHQVRYVGVENCKICHMPHYDSWLGTKMSKSFELLKSGVRAEAKVEAGLKPEKDYTHDKECLQCHVTGFGEPGGFVSIEETPEMANVECEMCHGPGSIYVDMMMEKLGTYTLDDYKEQGGLTMPSAEDNVCGDKCHNPNSPFVSSGFVFDFEDRKAIGTHRHDLDYIFMPFDI